MFIKLGNDINLEIEVIETKRSVDASMLYHLWAELPVDKKLIEKIINAGIRSLSRNEIEKLAEEHEGGVYHED